MNDAEIMVMAKEYLELYREILKIDPVFRLTVQTAEFAGASELIKDLSSGLSWILRLNPTRHTSSSDIKYSIVDCLVGVLLSDIDLMESNIKDEIKSRVVTRLTIAITDMIPDPYQEEQ